MKKIILSLSIVASVLMVTSAKAQELTVYEQNKGGSGAVLTGEEAQCTERPGQCNLHARDNNNEGYLFERNIQAQNARRQRRVADILAGREGHSSSYESGSGSSAGDQ